MVRRLEEVCLRWRLEVKWRSIWQRETGRDRLDYVAAGGASRLWRPAWESFAGSLELPRFERLVLQQECFVD